LLLVLLPLHQLCRRGRPGLLLLLLLLWRRVFIQPLLLLLLLLLHAPAIADVCLRGSAALGCLLAFALVPATILHSCLLGFSVNHHL
jgi:hypothetical protein